MANAAALGEGLAREGLRLVSGGTDNHLLLVDVRPQGVTGAAAEAALERAGIALNANMIPYDPQPPRVTSGVRLGTPAVTTRGMGLAEMAAIAGMIGRVLRSPEDAALAAEVRAEAVALCRAFPLDR